MTVVLCWVVTGGQVTSGSVLWSYDVMSTSSAVVMPRHVYWCWCPVLVTSCLLMVVSLESAGGAAWCSQSLCDVTALSVCRGMTTCPVYDNQPLLSSGVLQWYIPGQNFRQHVYFVNSLWGVRFLGQIGPKRDKSVTF